MSITECKFAFYKHLSGSQIFLYTWKIFSYPDSYQLSSKQGIVYSFENTIRLFV